MRPPCGTLLGGSVLWHHGSTADVFELCCIAVFREYVGWVRRTEGSERFCRRPAASGALAGTIGRTGIFELAARTVAIVTNRCPFCASSPSAWTPFATDVRLLWFDVRSTRPIRGARFSAGGLPSLMRMRLAIPTAIHRVRCERYKLVQPCVGR